MRINAFISWELELASRRHQRIKDKLEHIRGVLIAILKDEMDDLVWPGTHYYLSLPCTAHQTIS